MLPPRIANAQDAIWVGRIGIDTAVVEEARYTGARITGTIVNVAAGMLVQYYEADINPDGTVRSLRSWTMHDLSAPPPTDQPPSIVLEVGEDSIRLTRAGRNGPEVSAIRAVKGAVPIFDAFFNNPMALMDIALRTAAETGDTTLHLYYVGGPVVEELPLERTGPGHIAFPYILARQYPMLGDVQLRATVDDSGLAEFDASETTFKIVTERRPWADALTLARSFRERGLGAGGLSTMSPPQSAAGRIGAVDIEVTYGQPSRRGREIFPGVVPFGEVWRAGANAATQITFSQDVRVGGSRVPAGSYSLWVVPGERSDTLIINRATRIWGVMYDASQDLIRVPLRRDKLEIGVEALTYVIQEDQGAGWLELAWDDRRMRVRIEPDGQ